MLSVRQFFVVVFTPLARAMVGVNPNALTLVSVVAGVLAGVAFSQAHYGALFYALAAVLVAVSGSADSLDGIVARLDNRTSTAGEFFDHFGDRIVEVAVLVGIAASPGASTLLGLGVVILTQLHSYLGTQIEATFGRREYSGPGRAELFVGFVLFGMLLAASPGLSIPWGARRVSLADAAFVVLAIVTVAGLVHRLRRAWSLCTSPAKAGDREGRPR